MGWFERRLTKRRIERFIENPDAYLVVNPKFCNHVFINGVCSLCGIDEKTFNENSIKCSRCGKIHTKELGEFCLDCRTVWYDLRDSTLEELKTNFITSENYPKVKSSEVK